MSRKVTTRFRISGTLVAETPLHVGGVDGNPATDLPLSVDGSGAPYVPGTSLAGPLRHWLIERFDAAHVEKFWGRIPVKGKLDDKGHATYILVEDVKLPADARAEIRDSVGIDRAYGTAAEGIKFDREVLPKGTRIALHMTVDCTKDVDAQGEIRALLEALTEGEIRIGAAKTRGLGRVRLDNARVEPFHLNTKAGILAFLEHRKEQTSGKAGLDALTKASHSGREHARIRIDIDWTPKGPVMVKAGADGTVIDMMPLVTANGAGGKAPVIPGASSKGAIRQHSERILATVLQKPVAGGESGLQRFIDQLARLPLAETLYGAVKKREEVKKPGEVSRAELRQKSGLPQPGLGALRIDDCLAVLSLARTEWDAIADGVLPRQPATENDADKAARRERARAAAVKAARRHGIDVADHVAIDRWTGGAADGALFTAAEPRFKWNPLRIEIDTKRLVPASGEIVNDNDNDNNGLVAQAAVALLLLTLKDMANGVVPLGFGVNRGYGDIDVQSVGIAVEHAPEKHWAAALDGVRIEKQNGHADFTPRDKIKPFAIAWANYLEQWEEHDRKAKAAAEAETHP